MDEGMDRPELGKGICKDLEGAVTEPPLGLLQDLQLVWGGKHQMSLVVDVYVTNDEVITLQVVSVQLKEKRKINQCYKRSYFNE